MRKIFSFLVVFVLTAFAVQAQKKSPGKKHLDWGIKTGMNLSTLNMEGSSDAKWKLGFVAGPYFKINAGPNFAIQPEFVFSGMGVKLTDPVNGNSTLRINYFSIPLLARYKVSKQFAVVLGPQFDFLLQATNIAEQGNKNRITDDYNDKSINATGGLEYWPLKKVGFSARYIHGFTDIGKNGDALANTVSLKNQAVQLTVAVKL